jgi:LacI family transcriptional regulator
MVTAGRRATIQDIARAAGVSTATVSRVINGLPVADLALVERVRDAARELDYRPNAVARDFRRGVTHTIGVVVPDLANPFFAAVLKGMAGELATAEHRMLVADSGEDPAEELRLVDELSGRCDGIVLCSPRMPMRDLRQAARRPTPIVCTNRSVARLPLGTVGIDSSVGMVEAVEHLAALGHEHVGYLAGPRSSWSDKGRRAGLEEGARRHGVRATVRVAGSTSDGGYDALPGLLERRVTAVLAFSDLVALGALARLHELDVDVPRDLSVVGFDDIPVAAFLAPPLTTVNLPKEELGRRAWAMLREHMAGGAAARGALLPSRLVVRRSTARPAR